MKKQILILCMLVLAFSLGNVFAQAPSLPPTPLVCIDIDNPLQVVPGVAYTYTVDVPSPDGDKTYHWFVTQNVNFITAGGLNFVGAEVLGSSDYLASGSDHYNIATADENSISLTWQSFSLNPTEYLFVVIYVENEAPTAEGSCVTNNLKVYRITPLHSFTIDIANVDISDTTILPSGDFEQCVSDIQSAVFNPTNNGVVYDYGSNDLYFVVAAANLTGSYQLSVRFSADWLQPATPGGADGQVATLYQGAVWADVLAATGAGVPLNNGTAGTPPTPGIPVSFVVDNNDPIGTEGLMHYIKIVIDHNSFEAIEGPYPYTIQIDGVLVDGDGNPLSAELFGAVVDQYDIDDNCNGFGYEAFAKSATQLLTRRPTILSVPDTVVFLPIVD